MHAGDAGALVGVDLDERAAAQAAPGRDREFEPGAEPVGDAQRVHRDDLFGARDGRPVRTEPCRDRLFDAAVAPCLDHGAARPVRDAVPGQQRGVSGELGGLAGLGRQLPGPARPAARHGRGGVGLQHRPDPRPGLQQRRGDGQEERAGAGDQRPVARRQPLPLHERLRRPGGGDAGQLPARERQDAVVRARCEHQRAGAQDVPVPFRPVDLAAQHVDVRRAVPRAVDRPDRALRPPVAPRMAENVVAEPFVAVPGAVLAAGFRRRVDQGHLRPGAQRSRRRAQPGRTGPHDHDVPGHRPPSPARGTGW
nr:hypothetical protein [Actinomadura madurae]